LCPVFEIPYGSQVSPQYPRSGVHTLWISRDPFLTRRNRVMVMIEIIPVGVIRSPYGGRRDAPRQGAGTPGVSRVEIYPEYIPAIGSMEGITHIWVLYWMDQAERHLLTVRRPEWSEERPVFMIRSPARPNPIALSIGKIQSMEGSVIVVTGLEALDGSLVVDIKPYIRGLDCVPEPD
jgi:tRNA (adenine37-N6)-methyltransferase